LQRGEFEGPAGRFAQRTELTPLQAHILKTLEIAPPPRFQMIEPVAPETEAPRVLIALLQGKAFGLWRLVCYVSSNMHPCNDRSCG